MRTSLLAVASLLVAFAACAPSVTGASGGDDGGVAGGPAGTASSSSSGSTGGSSSTGSSKCPEGGYPCPFCAWSQGLTCTQPGECCYLPSCTDDMTGPFSWFVCTDPGIDAGTDAGTWQ
jgi:hypothetical protein